MFVDGIDRAPSATNTLADWRKKHYEQKLPALLFSIMIALSPALVVVLMPPGLGGAFVAGYLTGSVTAPFVVLGLFKAADDLFDASWLNSVLGVLIYLTAVVVLSLATIVWSFSFAGP